MVVVYGYKLGVAGLCNCIKTNIKHGNVLINNSNTKT